MPIYEYECTVCGHRFETYQPMEAADPPCPRPVKVLECFESTVRNKAVACGGKTKRQISRSSFHLKGGGWAADGYGGNSCGNKH